MVIINHLLAYPIVSHPKSASKISMWSNPFSFSRLTVHPTLTWWSMKVVNMCSIALVSSTGIPSVTQECLSGWNPEEIAVGCKTNYSVLKCNATRSLATDCITFICCRCICTDGNRVLAHTSYFWCRAGLGWERRQGRCCRCDYGDGSYYCSWGFGGGLMDVRIWCS